MKVVVTGAGQLAQALVACAPPGIDVVQLARNTLDITDATAVKRVVREHAPLALINAAAYTAVDKAEQEKHSALAVNADAPRFLAEACADLNAYFLHISTDFVFDGKAGKPYTPEYTKNPLSVYGESKARGEQAIAEASGSNWGIIRTAWVYSAEGRNFVNTMLGLMASRPKLAVVEDQIGSPTRALDLAEICWLAVDKQLQGIHHFTNAGVASWYDFAVAIQELALEKKLLKDAIPIAGIPSIAYPTPAARPHFSVLDKTSLVEALAYTPRHWREALAQTLDELVART